MKSKYGDEMLLTKKLKVYKSSINEKKFKAKIK